MLPSTFQPRRPFLRLDRYAHLTPPAPPGPTVDVVGVAVAQGTPFDWLIRWQFSDDLPAGLTLADVAGLRVASDAPDSVEDAEGNWVVLHYGTEGGPGAPWLVAPGGSPIFVPGQAGTVAEG